MNSMGGIRFWVATMAFAAAAVVFGATVIEAVRIDDETFGSGVVTSEGEAALSEADRSAREGASTEAEPEPESDEPSEDGASGMTWRSVLPGVHYPNVSNDEILVAVNQDLFQPDRTPPLERYLLPGQRPSVEQSSGREQRIRWPDIRVVGTAITGDLALAMVQPDDSIPFAVLEGEMVEGYTVAEVSEEFVTLAMGDAQFTYPVTEPQAGRGVSREQQALEQQLRGRGDLSEAQVRAITERMQQAIRMRGQGGRGGGGVQMAPAFSFSSVLVRPTGGTSGSGSGDVVIRSRGGAGGSGGGRLP